MSNILVTGGLGFIGSHTCVELINAGFTPIVIDNLGNSEVWIKERIEKIVEQSITFYEGDCRDKELLNQIFTTHAIGGVIHFAAHKAVGESVSEPLKYYENNLGGLTAILETTQKHNCSNLVFSSSCTVYGTPDHLPVNESAQIKSAESPYGTTKIICEKIIQDLFAADPAYKAILLRYFNPIGAHSTSLIGELPLGIPSNLVPFITQTAAGIRESLTVFGNDYNTKDGSCVRDFIHVTDLAKAHIKALEFLINKKEGTCEAVNIGTGNGNTVLELISAFEKVSEQKLNYSIGKRRDGDVEAVYADAKKSKELLGWEAKISLEQSLLDAWNWQKTLKK
ncbi:UDP-glucose 4-epimerase GalE [Reichenbachiella carrageenanivorans]|uniref:UDP-glucose 4-epimerase n=1 Tax=Reichenbachiella carrageenanivorans TaxID=2979869 RepID=A0ABY6D6V0_9BACT|nr:UDP-glucose 4-epimerase GalE [Reichenbachiella carrageenanivorans]UXX80803.1 UDP-glucose 4-epimerase GalE [Reichenbachiella carrageenanivorans]